MRIVVNTVLLILLAGVAWAWIWLFQLPSDGSGRAWAGIFLGPLAIYSSIALGSLGGLVAVISYLQKKPGQAAYAFVIAVVAGAPVAIGLVGSFWSQSVERFGHHQATSEVRKTLAAARKFGLWAMVANELDKAWQLNSTEVCFGEFQQYLQIAADQGDAPWAFRMAYCQFHGAIGLVDQDASICAKRMAEAERWLPRATDQAASLPYYEQQHLQELVKHASRYRKECDARLRGVAKEEAAKWRADPDNIQ